MRHIVYCLLITTLFTACKKSSENASSSKVEIYLLKSFSSGIDTANPHCTKITNAVVEDHPIITNGDIGYYVQSTATFGLKKNIKPVIQHFSHAQAFAVTVDKQPVYFGLFHPAYYSSLVFGLAVIDPILTSETEMNIRYLAFDASTSPTLDKRNDSRILNVLRSTGRLR